MAFNHIGAQKRAHRQIIRFGGRAWLRRNGVFRSCYAGFQEFKPGAIQLVNAEARVLAISAYRLDVAPDYEQDQVVFAGELLRIVAPIKGPRPKNIPIFYQCEVLYDSPHADVE